MMGKKLPPMERAVKTTIRGVVYRSQRQAALALGVTPQAVSIAAAKGVLDGLGLGAKAGWRAR